MLSLSSPRCKTRMLPLTFRTGALGRLHWAAEARRLRGGGAAEERSVTHGCCPQVKLRAESATSPTRTHPPPSLGLRGPPCGCPDGSSVPPGTVGKSPEKPVPAWGLLPAGRPGPAPAARPRRHLEPLPRLPRAPPGLGTVCSGWPPPPKAPARRPPRRPGSAGRDGGAGALPAPHGHSPPAAPARRRPPTACQKVSPPQPRGMERGGGCGVRFSTQEESDSPAPAPPPASPPSFRTSPRPPPPPPPAGPSRHGGTARRSPPRSSPVRPGRSPRSLCALVFVYPCRSHGFSSPARSSPART